MNLGHLFLNWGEGETFSPLAELKNEGHLSSYIVPAY